MTEQEQPSTPPPKNGRPKRRQIYVHRFQRSYAVGLGFFLFGYCVIVFGLAFVLPYLMPAIRLLSHNSVEDRAFAATQLLSLVQNVWPGLVEIATSMWPALIALVVSAAVFSIYLTHRVAGPLYRFQRSTAELAEGNLALRIRLRDGDELHELADLANQAVAKLDQAMIEIRDRTAGAKNAMRAVMDGLKSTGGADQANVDRLEEALNESQRIEDVLKRFRVSDSL